jgi:hypothetical protein
VAMKSQCCVLFTALAGSLSHDYYDCPMGRADSV